MSYKDNTLDTCVIMGDIVICYTSLQVIDIGVKSKPKSLIDCVSCESMGIPKLSCLVCKTIRERRLGRVSMNDT